MLPFSSLVMAQLEICNANSSKANAAVLSPYSVWVANSSVAKRMWFKRIAVKCWRPEDTILRESNSSPRWTGYFGILLFLDDDDDDDVEVDAEVDVDVDVYADSSVVDDVFGTL